jgi:hypothetical protein
MLQYDTHSLLELQALLFTGGAIDECWRGGVHGPVEFFFFFSYFYAFY